MKCFFTGLGVLGLSIGLQAQIVNNGSNVVFSNGVAVQASGNVQNQAGSTLSNNGNVTVTGTLNNNGTVKGNGTFSTPADITNLNGIVSPGNENVGQLNVSGIYNNGAGTLAIEIGGPTAGTGYDRLAVTGAVSIAGTLNVNIINAYAAPPSTTFDVVTGTSVSGTFGTLNLPAGWTVNYLSDRIQVQSPAPLPVLVEYFRGNTRDKINYLDWKVNCNGPGTYALHLQRSTDGKQFGDIYQKETDAQNCDHAFAYEDKQPAPGINYYRLTMAEEGGKVTYSSVVALNSGKESFKVLDLSPNPVNINATIHLSATQKGKLNILVTDAVGRKIIEQHQSLETGLNAVGLRGVQNLTPGLYQVSLFTDDGQVQFLKFAKQ